MRERKKNRQHAEDRPPYIQAQLTLMQLTRHTPAQLTLATHTSHSRATHTSHSRATHTRATRNSHVTFPRHSRNSHVILPRNSHCNFSGRRGFRAPRLCRDSIPLLSLSSCEAEWSGLVRILFVEPGDSFEFVNIFRWLPVGLVEAGPFDKVLESSSMHP
jgi:hypothetical protein